MYGSIRIRGARENNLKNVSLDIPNKDDDGGAAELPVVARCLTRGSHAALTSRD
jgi:hypothetical protein